MPELIHHTAAWRGDQLFRRPDWRRELTPEETAEILAIKGSTRPGEQHDAAAQQVTRLPTLAPMLKQIQHALEHESGMCLVQGLPIDALNEEDARHVFWSLASHIGTPVSQSATGERIFSVRDEGYETGHPRARGPNTKNRLRFHTDRCDVIAFLCLRPAKSGGGNQIVSSMAVYNEMLARRADLVDVLMRPYYSRRHNVDTGNVRPWCEQPIFSFCEGHFAASYLRVLIDRAYAMPELPEMTPEQREALDLLEEIAADPQLHINLQLQRGDVLFLNNWVTLHRRDEFADHAEPSKRRHLLRIWLAVPNSRPLDPRFKDNFGATEAGAVRGGMPAAD